MTKIWKAALAIVALPLAAVSVVLGAAFSRRRPPASRAPEDRGGQRPRGLLLTWPRAAILLGLLAVIGGGGGFLFAASGLYDVSAATGHWPITQRFLTFAMARSVANHANEIEVPSLDHPALVYLGLGHYDQGCAPCHGAPGERRNPIMTEAVPSPPYLPDVVLQWEAQELFWITKRGLKYTGMPGWPTLERDDEVWAIVAGMLRMPDMEVDEYRRIVRGERLTDHARIEQDAHLLATAGAVGQDLVACARCHGLRGEGRGFGAFPPIAGQTEEYLYEALRAYALGERQSGVMQAVVGELTEVDLRDLARFYASLPPTGPTETDQPRAPDDAAAVARGAELARSGSAADLVPACIACHGPAAGPRHDLYPGLAGQPEFYLEQQLRLWRASARSRTPQAEVMHFAARRLEDGQIRDLAAYYSSLPLGASGGGGSTPRTAP